MLTAHAELSSNTKIAVIEPGPPPEDVKWVKDLSINPRTRKQLISGFWGNHRGISGHVAYVSNESDRDRLRREGKVMIRISDLSAQHVNVISPISLFKRA